MKSVMPSRYFSLLGNISASLWQIWWNEHITVFQLLGFGVSPLQCESHYKTTVHHGMLLLAIQTITVAFMCAPSDCICFCLHEHSKSLLNNSGNIWWDRNTRVSLLTGLSMEPGRQQPSEYLRLKSNEERGKVLILSGVCCTRVFQKSPASA